MVTADIAKLRALAAVATPGPWVLDGTETVIFTDEGPVSARVASSRLLADADYIAALDPQTILGLLDELERLRAVELMTRFVAGHWRDALMLSIDQHPGNAVGTHVLALVLAALDGERDPVHLGLNDHALAAPNEALRDALAALDRKEPRQTAGGYTREDVYAATRGMLEPDE